MLTSTVPGVYPNPVVRAPNPASSKSRRIQNGATTIDRDPADPFRAAVFVGADDVEILRVSVERELGGPADAPSGGDLLCAALAASLDASIRAAARAAGIPLAGLCVDVRGWSDVRGVLGIDRDVPVGFQTIACAVRIEPAGAVDAGELRRMLAAAESACTVLATLRRAVPCHIRIENVQPAARDVPLAKAA
ncbi:MAG: OsmC family protein [Burkholderiales bacterium]|jgi:uncharacterized OsmC-like protein|nr:OsmC family protein [Burkholderiales bacterium]